MTEYKRQPDQDSVTRSHQDKPENVGKSTRPRGEEERQREPEPGRRDVQPHGPSQRPAGTSTARDSTGIDPQDPIDPSSPSLR